MSSRQDPHASSSRLVGISLLLTAKGMDLATTASVVVVLPGTEANQVIAPVVLLGGAPALVVLSIVVCGAVVAVVETAASTLRDRGPLAPVWIRLCAYGPLTVLWTAAAIRNVREISGAFA